MPPATVLSPTSVEPKTTLTIELQTFDQAAQQHLSSPYWAWHDLFERDPSARISQHPDHVLAELTAAETSRPIVLCQAVQGDQWQGLGILVPKTMTSRQAGAWGVSVPLAGYRLAGNRFLGNLDGETQRLLLQGCLDFVARERALFLMVEDLEASDPLCDTAREVVRERGRLFFPSGWQDRRKIEFPSPPDEYWKKFSSKTRNTFRRKQKKIGASRLVRVSEAEQVSEFLSAAHQISQHTWQSQKLGLRIQNNETELRLFTFLATQRALRSYLLFVDEKPAAFLMGTQFNGHFAYEEVGYHRDYADRSPGQVLLLHVLDDLLKDNPPRVFDFGGGDADYKRLFATVTTQGGSVWLMPNGVRPTLWWSFLRGCRWLDRTARATVETLGLTTRLRQWIRGKHARFESPASSSDDGAEAASATPEVVTQHGGGA